MLIDLFIERLAVGLHYDIANYNGLTGMVVRNANRFINSLKLENQVEFLYFRASKVPKL